MCRELFLRDTESRPLTRHSAVADAVEAAPRRVSMASVSTTETSAQKSSAGTSDAEGGTQTAAPPPPPPDAARGSSSAEGGQGGARKRTQSTGTSPPPQTIATQVSRNRFLWFAEVGIYSESFALALTMLCCLNRAIGVLSYDNPTRTIGNMCELCWPTEPRTKPLFTELACGKLKLR